VRVLTVGHSNRSSAEFIALLQHAAVTLVADVRAMARSRANPQFNGAALRGALAAAGIGYRHLPALGGRRQRQRDAPASPNSLWRNPAFRNYADYAATAQFRAALAELVRLAAGENCALMCAEALWWRCHRRIIADYLLTGGLEVAHILGPSGAEPATLTPGARRLPDGTLVYEQSTPLAAAD
jgi:uncharacterized protein (DUF488 family)